MEEEVFVVYESPIKLILNETTKQLGIECENAVVKASLEMGVDVNKDELIKALAYDRDQYIKGFNDAIKEVLTEIGKWSGSSEWGRELPPFELIDRIRDLEW